MSDEPVDAKRLLQGLGAEHLKASPGGAAPDSWQLGADLQGLVPARELETGALVGEQFEILSVLGRGAMGRVLEARDTTTGREVALKLILAGRETGQLRTRLQREAELTARIQHPGIPKIHGVGDHAGLPFVIYEKIKGARTAAKVYPELDREARLDLLEAVASALSAAHAADVVHRDLKPENVLIDSGGRAYVVDFGLAFDPQSVERMTQTGTLLGSPLYMSPEQVVGQRSDTGPASDVWALGVFLYELLADRLPFEAESLPTLTARICSGAPTSFREVAREPVPKALATVCLTALQKTPNDRYPNAGAFLEALEDARQQHPPPRTPLAFVAGVAVVALLGGALAFAGRGAVLPRTQPPVASHSPDGVGDLQTRDPQTRDPQVETRPVVLPWERTFRAVSGLGFADEDTVIVASDTALSRVNLRQPHQIERDYVSGTHWELRNGTLHNPEQVRMPAPDFRSSRVLLREAVSEARISPSRLWLAVAIENRVRVVSVDDPSRTQFEGAHEERVEGLEIDDRHVVALGRNGLTWWDLNTGETLNTLLVRPESAALDPDGETLFVGNTDGVLMHVRLADAKLLHTFERANTETGVSVWATGAHLSRISRVRVLAGGAAILSVARSSDKARSFALWARDGRELWRSDPKPYGYDLVAISPSGQRAAIGSRATNHVVVLDLELDKHLGR